MNWLQRIILSQSLAPTYIGVGHNYRWNEDRDEYEELWQAKDSGDVIIWYHKNGRITEQEGLDAHWVEDADASGRIETGTSRGSISFNTKERHLKRKILEDLTSQYPGVKFGIYASGGPYTLQQYWGML